MVFLLVMSIVKSCNNDDNNLEDPDREMTDGERIVLNEESGVSNWRYFVFIDENGVLHCDQCGSWVYERCEVTDLLDREYPYCGKCVSARKWLHLQRIIKRNQEKKREDKNDTPIEKSDTNVIHE